jgi:glycerol-3-phosphate dehydrogenase
MNLHFSSKNREKMLQELERKSIDQPLDLLIIGGGITGAGIALDAQTRGISTALIEMQDFAAGTSSRSTKLVHGGLRYLKQLEVKLVAEVGKERAIVYENGPHVTTPEWMLLPIYKNGSFGKFSTSIGLWVYDFLAGVRRSERRKMLDIQKTLSKEPLLKKDGLKGSGFYVEYRTDDARLTIEVLKEAVSRGAQAVNYARADHLLYQDEKVIGVCVIDQMNGNHYQLYAKKIVNATGPWVDQVREKDRSKIGKSLKLTKGVHLVFDQKSFPLQQAIYFDTLDGRMIFAIPREGKTYIGTTDTVYDGDIAHPTMTIEDRDYILEAIHYMFPTLQISEEDVESSWAGLRPLIHEDGKNPSEISRKDEVWHSASGLISIAGGKLTGFRKMAEDVVDHLASLLQKEGNGPYLPCQTKKMPISGGKVGGASSFTSYIDQKVKMGIQYGFTQKQAENLVRLYGSNIDRVYQLAKGYEEQSGQHSEEEILPLELYTCLQYGIEEEMVTKPTDFFIRRTGALFFDISSVRKWKDKVIHYMSKELQWSAEEMKGYAAELNTKIINAVDPRSS